MMVVVHDSGGVEVMPLSVKNVLLRGCNLRNTDWVFGLVLNTGNDTKNHTELQCTAVQMKRPYA